MAILGSHYCPPYRGNHRRQVRSLYFNLASMAGHKKNTKEREDVLFTITKTTVLGGRLLSN